MKDFHAEPINRDLDRNQTLSCPANPCLESVIHLLNQVCSWWFSTEGPTGQGRERGKSYNTQISSIRVRLEERNRAVIASWTLCFQQRESSRGDFLKLMSWWKASEQWRERQGPPGAEQNTVPLLPFNKTE